MSTKHGGNAVVIHLDLQRIDVTITWVDEGSRFGFGGRPLFLNS